jgi:hypothetical protein
VRPDEKLQVVPSEKSVGVVWPECKTHASLGGTLPLLRLRVYNTAGGYVIAVLNCITRDHYDGYLPTADLT